MNTSYYFFLIGQFCFNAYKFMFSIFIAFKSLLRENDLFN